MNALLNHSDWAGVALALVAALVLIGGFFLISWINRTLTQRRVGFFQEPRSGHHLPDPGLEESYQDEHPVA